MKRRKTRKKSSVRYTAKKRRASRPTRRRARRSAPRRAVARRTTRRRRSAPRRAVARVTRRRSSARRSVRRRSMRRGIARRASGGSLRSGIRGFVNKEMLLTAGGAIGSTLLTNYILGHFGPQKMVGGVAVMKGANEFVLPGLRPGADGRPNTLAVLAYATLIPLAGALAVRKVNPTLAKGFAIGGLISGLSNGIQLVRSRAVVTQSAIAAGTKPAGEFFSRRQLGVGQTPSAQAVGANPYGSANAFKAGAFSR